MLRFRFYKHLQVELEESRINPSILSVMYISIKLKTKEFFSPQPPPLSSLDSSPFGIV